MLEWNIKSVQNMPEPIRGSGLDDKTVEFTYDFACSGSVDLNIDDSTRYGDGPSLVQSLNVGCCRMM